jgi:hypothetical protein
MSTGETEVVRAERVAADLRVDLIGAREDRHGRGQQIGVVALALVEVTTEPAALGPEGRRDGGVELGDAPLAQ